MPGQLRARWPRPSGPRNGLSWPAGPHVLGMSSGLFPEAPDLPARADGRGVGLPPGCASQSLMATHSRAGSQEAGSSSDPAGPPFCRTGNQEVGPGLVGTMTVTGLGPAACAVASTAGLGQPPRPALRPLPSPVVFLPPPAEPEAAAALHTSGRAQQATRGGVTAQECRKTVWGPGTQAWRRTKNVPYAEIITHLGDTHSKPRGFASSVFY